MKIIVAKEDLKDLRDLLWEGRSHYSRAFPVNKEKVAVATKHIKRVNAALKQIHGHDCNGDIYI